VKLPQCWNCRRRFQWKEIVLFVTSKKCPSCGKTNYLPSRKKYGTGNILLILVLLIGMNVMNTGWIGNLLFAGFLTILWTVLLPFTYTFIEEEDSLF